MNLHAMHTPAALRQRFLAEDDLGDILRLHQRCIQGIAESLVRVETMASLQQLMQRGQFLGLFDESRLVAYGVMLQHLDDPERLPASIAPDTSRPQALLGGMAVAPEWRGLGLQRRLIMERVAQAPPQALVFSTAAPGNWFSWNNLLACGFHTRALCEQYAGHLRYLMVLEPLPQSALYPDYSQEVHALDIARQQVLLGQGWRGAQPGHNPQHLRYVPVAASSQGAAA